MYNMEHNIYNLRQLGLFGVEWYHSAQMTELSFRNRILIYIFFTYITFSVLGLFFFSFYPYFGCLSHNQWLCGYECCAQVFVEFSIFF